MITVGIAEDQALVRESLAIVLNLERDLEVQWTACTGREAVDHLRHTPVDVILVDLRMPELDGVSAIRQIMAHLNTTKVIVLTTFHQDEWLMDALQAGAAACFLKEVPPETLVEGIRRIHAGTWSADAMNGNWQRYVPAIQFRLPVSETKQAFTERELAVLSRLCQGETNTEIAHSLHLSEGTIKNYVSQVYAKLNVRHRAEAMTEARRLGIW